MLETDVDFYVDQVTSQHFQHGEIGRKSLREGRVGGCGHLQGLHLRKQDDHGDAGCQEGIEGELEDLLRVVHKDGALDQTVGVHAFDLFTTHRSDEEERQEVEDQGQADHDRNVVVGKYAEGQADAVHQAFILVDQTFQSQNDDREQDQTVEPHDVPAVCCHVTGECVEGRKKRDTQMVGTGVLTQVPGKGETAERDLQNDHVTDELDNEFHRTQEEEPV